MKSEEFVKQLKNYVSDHKVDSKMKNFDENNVSELLASIKKDLIISQKLTEPKYRRGGVIGKLANFILGKYFRVTRKMFFGTLVSQDSINNALFEAIERLDKKISKQNEQPSK